MSRIKTQTITFYFEGKMDLKKLRTEKGLTQEHMAKLVGVSLVTYRLWENGVTTPRYENAEKLKQVLGENYMENRN